MSARVSTSNLKHLRDIWRYRTAELRARSARLKAMVTAYSAVPNHNLADMYREQLCELRPLLRQAGDKHKSLAAKYKRAYTRARRAAARAAPK